MATSAKAAGKKAGKSSSGKLQAKSPAKRTTAKAPKPARAPAPKKSPTRSKGGAPAKRPPAAKARAAAKPSGGKAKAAAPTTRAGAAKKAPIAPKKAVQTAKPPKQVGKTAAAAPKPQRERNGLTVERYLRTVPAWQKEIMAALRELVKSIEPVIEETMKWGQPVYEAYGPLVYMKGFAKFVNFGFFRGSELTDPQGLLLGEGGRMRHLKISSAQKMPLDAIERFVREAIYLNREKSIARQDS